MAWCKDCGGDEHIGRLCPPKKQTSGLVFEAPRRRELGAATIKCTCSGPHPTWMSYHNCLVHGLVNLTKTLSVHAPVAKEVLMGAMRGNDYCTCTTRFHDTPDCPIHDKTREQFADQAKYAKWAHERDSLIEWARNRLGHQPVQAWR